MVTTKELDEVAKELREVVDKDRKISRELDEVKAQVTILKKRMMALLEEAEKTSYHAEGSGLCTVKSSLSVTTPKDIESKKAFFLWIKEAYGDDGFWSYLSINSQTLNSLYNSVIAEKKDPTFVMPGLTPPIEYKTLSFLAR